MNEYSNQSGRGNDPLYWLIAIGLIFTGIAAPVGILMIVLRLLGGGKRGRHPYYEQQEGQDPVGARTGGAVRQDPVQRGGKAGKRARTGGDRLTALDRKGRQRMIWGGGAAAIALVGFISSLGDPLYLLFQGHFASFMAEIMGLMVLPCVAAGGLGFLVAGLRKRKQVRRYRGYLAMIGRQSTISVSTLASATGRTPDQVRDDLADMLADGLFPQGFLDYGGDRLVLSGDGLQDPPPRPRQDPAPQQPPKEDENAILAEIRAVNDAIDNQKLSAQIDRVGVITAKILDYQKTHPEKSPQLHSFLSYYLPTTLKVLRAYGQLEDQEVSGENITAAMQRIEGMMDKVVEGFEKQLDLLFQGDAMDITADVEVLERMLAKDGLSDQGGLTLGV